MTAIVLGVLGLWLVASVANQVPGPWARFLGPLGGFSVLPGLAFFAPDPIDVDYHLVVRDFLDDGQAGPWKEIPPERHGPLRALWSTAKRDHQAMLGAVSALASIQQSVAPVVAEPAALMQISFPYLFLLHRARQAPRDPEARERQFMIVETKGFGAERRMDLGILSNPHRLD
jgi:hypothetical protein